MNKPPKILGGAKSVRWTAIDTRHRPTGNCRHAVAGDQQGPAAGLAICRLGAEEGYALFGCDAEWHVVTDTWHEGLEGALQQAEFEYEGVSRTWEIV